MQSNIRYIADVEDQNDLGGKQLTNGEKPKPNWTSITTKKSCDHIGFLWTHSYCVPHVSLSSCGQPSWRPPSSHLIHNCLQVLLWKQYSLWPPSELPSTAITGSCVCVWSTAIRCAVKSCIFKLQYGKYGFCGVNLNNNSTKINFHSRTGVKGLVHP